MKVFMLANPVAVHTQKWVKALSDRGIDVLLYSFRPYREIEFYKEMKRVEVRGFTKERNARGIKSFFLFKLFWYYIPLVVDIKCQIRAFKRISCIPIVLVIMAYSGSCPDSILFWCLPGGRIFLSILQKVTSGNE